MEDIEKFTELVKALNGVGDTRILALALKASKFADKVDVQENITVTVETPVSYPVYVPVLQPTPITPFYTTCTVGDGNTGVTKQGLRQHCIQF